VANKKSQRRQFSDQYKAEVVELIRTSGKSIGGVAKDLGLADSVVRNWVKMTDRSGNSRASEPSDSGRFQESCRLKVYLRYFG